jgi:CRP/FNR family cyclic AMP-dependent transcriptional regulator
MEDLRNISLFSALDEEELQSIRDKKIVRRFPKDAVILSEGDNSDALYVIKSGGVKVVKSGPDGKEVVIAMMAAGDYFGEMALIDEQPRSASIVAKIPSELVIIRKQDFQDILMNNPSFALSVMKGLCNRLRGADRNIESLATMDVYGRIARLLLDMAEPKDGKMVVPERMTHQEIANMVGSSREMVTRILRDLTTGEYISINERLITIETKLPQAW